VNDLDPRLVAAMSVQLDRRRGTLDAGAEHVGWKLGIGTSERIGTELAVGHLTSATRLEPGATYHAGNAADLYADAEIAVELGGRVERYAAALELVDLGDAAGEPEAIVAANVFHRAFALGPFRAAPPDGEGRLIVNGETRAAAPAPRDLTDRVRAAARILESVGERLRPGDRVITGNVVQVAVEPGDDVIADFGSLGRVRLVIAP
jgi:hypothetical protein